MKKAVYFAVVYQGPSSLEDAYQDVYDCQSAAEDKARRLVRAGQDKSIVVQAGSRGEARLAAVFGIYNPAKVCYSADHSEQLRPNRG